MIYEFLKPVSAKVLRFVEQLPTHSIGKNIDKHTVDNFPDFEQVKLALITVNDTRGGQNAAIEKVDFDVFRQKFYSLFPGNWTSTLVDLGTIDAGESVEDTYFLVKKVVADLLRKQILPLVVGASQDVTYAIYRAYDQAEQMVNLSTIDSKIDVVSDVNVPSESFISRIIMEEPNNLLNFSNLGYQTYFNSQEEIDLIDKMYFEAYRLGDVINDMTLAEPILRDSDIVSIDLHAIKHSELGVYSADYPNGFDGREICVLARYAGLSDRVSSFGVFNVTNETAQSLLISQILWYFIEGFNFRMNEYPYISKKTYFKYIVPQEGTDLVFYKSDLSGRWWIEIEHQTSQTNVLKTLFPCSYSDYKKALENELPERWWRAKKKLLG